MKNNTAILGLIRERKEVQQVYSSIKSAANLEFDKWSKSEFACISNLIEGGELSRMECKQIIEKGLAIGGKSLAEQNNVQLYAQAVDWIRRSESLSRYDITEQLLISLHHLSMNTDKPQGFLRYSYQVPYVLTEYIEWFRQQDGMDAEVAVAAYLKMLDIHPFSQDTAQTAWLFLNLVLLQAGYPLVLVEHSRIQEYKQALENCITTSSKDELETMLYESILYSLDTYLKVVEKKQPIGGSQLLKIGELAQIANESIPTIRHWTKEGLLKVAEYSRGGYQLYDPGQAEVVLMIRDMQSSKRLTLREIRGSLIK